MRDDTLVLFGDTIKALGDGKVGGYLVKFTDASTPDLTGEFFDASTDFDIEPGDKTRVYYNHGLDATLKRRKLGSGTLTIDDAGVWVEAQLALRDDYERSIYQMAEAGKLGWSSGTLPNLVEYADAGTAKRIVTWPLGKDASLTPTPAAGMAATRVVTLKTWAQNSDNASLPEAKAQGASTVPPQATQGASDNDNQGDTMADEVLDAIKAQGDAITALTAQLKALTDAPPVKKVDVAIVEDETDKQAKGNPFKSFGEFLQAVRGFNQGNIDKRLLTMRSSDPLDEAGFNVAKAMGDAFVGSLPAVKAAPSGIGESLPQAGGLLVGSDRNTSILSRVYDSSQLLSRIAMDTVGQNSNGMTYYVEAETSRATGSRRGGVRFYWAAENSAVTTSAPTFAEMELKLKKAAAAVYVTEEQLQDTPALESYVMRIMPEEIRFGVEDSIINGTGTGQPLGILNANCLVTASKEANQTAKTITAKNIVGMWARLWSRSVMNAVWIVNQDVFPQLFALSVPVGTGGQLVYMPPGGISGAPYGTLFGRPVIVHESSATLGTVGDIILADLREYQGIEKGGIQSASSIHVRFLEGESVYRFIYRVDGQPAWRAALTPFKAGTATTVSPFIALETR